MKSSNRLMLVLLTGVSVFVLLIEFIIFWNHWFLPDPLYTVHSYSEVLQNEIIWGVKNLLFEALLLFLPMYILILFLKSKQTIKKRMLVVLIIIVFISGSLTIREIVNDLNAWKPLEHVTQDMKERTFELGRTSFIPMKQYTIYFSTQASDLYFIQADILPTFTNFDYFVTDFDVSIGNQHYTSIADSSPSDIHVQNIQDVSFKTHLQKLDYASINFRKSNSVLLSKQIHLLINNYEEDGVIKGRLRTP